MLVVVLLAVSAPAAPFFSVVPQGLNGSGNRIWQALIAPDPALIVGGNSSLAIDMGFSVTGANFLSHTVNTAVFDFALPGNNPFTNSVSSGATMTPLTLHASFGSAPLSSGTPITFISFVTSGSGFTTINWLGAYSGNGRIAQEGVNYDLYRGSVNAVPEASAYLFGFAAIAIAGSGSLLRRKLATA